MIVRARGRPTPRPVGNIQAVSVDWQPRPHGRPSCVAPPGSKVLASSAAAVVTGDGLPLPAFDFSDAAPVAYMGCLRATGRERLLERYTANNIDSATFVDSALVAAPYAGLVIESVDGHYGGESQVLRVFDLRTGQQTTLGGENAFCPGISGTGACGQLDSFVLGGDGVSAAHAEYLNPVGSLSTPLSQVTCAPGSTTCLAIDNDGIVFSSNDPAGGAGAWNRATVGPQTYGPTTIACPSSSLCVGASTSIYTTSDPTGGASAWSRTMPTASAYSNDIACPSSSLCVIARADGSVATSTNPTGGPGAWSTSEIDSDHSLNAIFCSAEPRCFVTDSKQSVFTSAGPTGGTGAWTVSSTTPPFVSGSCPTAGLCVAVNGQSIQTTTDPAAGAWTTRPIADDLFGISCPSASLCLAVGWGGALDTSTDPAAGTWTHATIDSGRHLTAISCPSASLCVATDSTGHVVVSTDPTGGPSTWQPALLDGDPCADTTPCSVEQIQASDGHGLRTVDSIEMSGNGPFLTALRLSGDELSWSHDGGPRSMTLTPP